MLKRIVSLTLAVMLLMGMAVITTSAADGSVIETLINSVKAVTGEGTATITAVDWSGTTQTHTFNVGDQFTVISYLQVPSDKKVNAINFSQQFNIGDATVELTSHVDDVDDPDSDYPKLLMFPQISGAVANVTNGNTILANGATANYRNAFKFSNADSILLKADYKVIAAGTTTIKTDILTLATVDSSDTMTAQITQSQKVGEDVINTRTVISGVEDPIMPSENPTLSPTEPATEIAPTEPPTEADVTDAPATEAPTEVAPTSDLWVVADGKWYAVQPNQKIEYIYYLNNGEKLCSLDAETTYDTDGLLWNEPYIDDDGEEVFDTASLFPIIKDSTVFNNSVAGRVRFNFSSASGKNFNTDDKQLIHMNFTVTAEKGIYYIDTKLHTVAGLDEHKYIFRDEVIDPLKRAEGGINSLTPADDHPATETPTEAPTEVAPTTPADDSAVWVVADGKWYAVQPNQEIEYVYYLNNGEKVCSLDAVTTFDTAGLSWNKPYDGDEELDYASLFPIIKDSMILNDKVDGRLKYNYSDANGKNFNADEKELIHMTFTVTADEGIYHIDTGINTVAGKDEHKYVFKNEVVDPLQRAEGVLNALTPAEDHPAESIVPGNAFFLIGSFTDWMLDENYQLTPTNNADAEEYGITDVYMTASDAFKAAKSSESGTEIAAWYPDGTGIGISPTADGEYTVLFRPNGDGSAEDGWIYTGPYTANDLAPTGYSDNAGYYFKLIPHSDTPDVSPTEVPVVDPTEAPYEEPTDVPATEAATETPATEAPTVTPATEAPATEAPATEAASVSEETNGSSAAGIGSNVIYFNVGSTDWSDYDSIGFHVWAIDDDAFHGYFWEDPEQVGKKASDGKWYYDFDAAGIDIKKGKQYAVVFYAIKDGKATDQTYNLLFGTPCIGHTAFCDGTVVENPEDSEKDTLIAYWDKSIDSSIYGPELQITSIGTVVGTSCPSGSTPYALFLDFLYNKLKNARIYSGKTDQELLDSIGSALGFGQATVQKAINETGLSISWDSSKSSLADDLSKESNSTPVKKTEKTVTTPKAPEGSEKSPVTGTSTVVFIIMAALLAGFAGVILASKKLRKSK